MKFALTDNVLELEAGKRIVTVKNVCLAEEYLQDHFPIFPVLPGVFMVQAMVEAATWLVRATEGFKHSMITLAEARNVKYQSFVKPGEQMRVEVTADEIGPTASKFRGQARVSERVVVQARLTLRHENLGDTQPNLAHVDGQMIERFRRHWEMIKPA
ncbi:MAG: beta-hydroxyacyl-ACP dehydratase [Phycisphaerae bacterium]|nr:beta-hydroxyacyl-ACP dehydratase [Phycisphaerae bacterium]